MFLEDPDTAVADDVVLEALELDTAVPRRVADGQLGVVGQSAIRTDRAELVRLGDDLLFRPGVLEGLENRCINGLGAGFVPVRKLGKLPADVVSVEYDLEYGSATLEMHRDAIKPGAKVLIIDDLLATGGTVAGTIELVKQLKGEIVALAFLIELVALKGRDKLAGYDIVTLIQA